MVGRLALAGMAVIAALALGTILVAVRPDMSLAEIKGRSGSLVLSKDSTFVPLNERASVHLRDQGKRDGKALVLLHDANSSLHTFEPWAALLGRHYRVVSLDLPGHGLTGPVAGADESAQAMVPVLDKVTRALGLTQFVLVGIGMGGDLALRYALAHPERVSELVLIAPQGLPSPSAIAGHTPFLLRFAKLPLAGKLARVFNLKGLVRAELEQAFFDDARVREDMVARQWLLLRREGNREALLARLSRRTGDGLAEELGAIKQPTLLLWGEEDEKAPVREALRYQEALPHAALAVLERAGHFVQEEAAVDSAALVNSFLLGLPVAREESTAAVRRLYSTVPPLPAMPIKPVEIRPLDPLRLKTP